MAYPKKHLSPWFTTERMRSVDLRRVTEIRFNKEGDRVIDATVFQTLTNPPGQLAIKISAKDAVRIYDRLI